MNTIDIHFGGIGFRWVHPSTYPTTLIKKILFYCPAAACGFKKHTEKGGVAGMDLPLLSTFTQLVCPLCAPSTTCKPGIQGETEWQKTPLHRLKDLRAGLVSARMPSASGFQKLWSKFTRIPIGAMRFWIAEAIVRSLDWIHSDITLVG